MKGPILVVTSHFIKPVEARIENDYEARRKTDGTSFTPNELLAAAEGADAILVMPFDRLDAEFFRRVSPSVKVISTHSVGVDHIDMEAAAERNIAIGYTPAEVTDATADLAMLLRLGASRRAFEAQELVRSGEWTIPRAGTLLGLAGDGQEPWNSRDGAYRSSCREARKRFWNEDPLLQPAPVASREGRRRGISC